MCKRPKRVIKWYSYSWVYYEPRLKRFTRTSWYTDHRFVQASTSIDKVACIVRTVHRNYTLRRLYDLCQQRGLPKLNFAMQMYRTRSIPYLVWINGDVSREECLRIAIKS